MVIFVLFSFFLLRNIGGTYSKYFENTITKLIAHLRLSDQLPDVPLEEAYIHSRYVIYDSIQNNFNAIS